MAVFEWTEQTPVTANNLNVMQEDNQDEVDTKITTAMDRIGKTLWEGSFSSGTLSVPHISEYTMICVLAGGLLMVGNQSYGGMVFRAWRSTSTTAYAYRYTYNATNETLTIDTDNAGATNGTNNIAITKIIGVF